MRNSKLITFFYLFIVILNSANVFGTVGGPKTIDIIGYDSITNIAHFVYVDWNEEKWQFWSYDIHENLLKKAPFEAYKMYYASNREEILKSNNLNNLTKIDTVNRLSNGLYKIEWLAEKKVTALCCTSKYTFPFDIIFQNKKYRLRSCSEQRIDPIIKEYEVTEKAHFLFIRYIESCYMGYTKDTIIFFQNNKGEAVNVNLTDQAINCVNSIATGDSKNGKLNKKCNLFNTGLFWGILIILLIVVFYLIYRRLN